MSCLSEVPEVTLKRRTPDVVVGSPGSHIAVCIWTEDLPTFFGGRSDHG